MALVIARIQLDGIFEFGDRFFQTVLVLEQAAQIQSRLDEIRCLRERPAQQVLGLAHAPGLARTSGQQAQRIDVLRVTSQEFAQ